MVELTDEAKYPPTRERGNRKALSSDSLPPNRQDQNANSYKLPDVGGHPIANTKHELFCRRVSQGDSLVDAYEGAGFKRSTANASTLAKRQDIRDRIEYLEAFERNRRLEHEIACRNAGVDPDEMDERLKAAFNYTTQTVCDMFRENAKLAQIAGQFKSAHDSITSIAKILKITEEDVPNGKPTGDKNSLTFIKEAAIQLSSQDTFSPARTPNALRPRVSDTGED